MKEETQAKIRYANEELLKRFKVSIRQIYKQKSLAHKLFFHTGG